jgi:hypothetical protein
LTGYIDEGDFMRIPGIPVDYIGKEKKANSSKLTKIKKVFKRKKKFLFQQIYFNY